MGRTERLARRSPLFVDHDSLVPVRIPEIFRPFRIDRIRVIRHSRFCLRMAGAQRECVRIAGFYTRSAADAVIRINFCDEIRSGRSGIIDDIGVSQKHTAAAAAVADESRVIRIVSRNLMNQTFSFAASENIVGFFFRYLS